MQHQFHQLTSLLPAASPAAPLDFFFSPSLGFSVPAWKNKSEHKVNELELLHHIQENETSQNKWNNK